MKKLVFIFFIIFVFTISVQTVRAEKSFGQIRKEIQQEVRNELQQNLNQPVTNPAELRNQIREEVRERVREEKQNLLENIKNKIKKNLRWGARVTGSIASISEASMTVTTTEGKMITVNITDQTHLRRRFWGKSELSEFAVGHQVVVIGRWTDENQTTIDARLIRNLSIQRRWGVFFGKITAKNTDSFVIETVGRGSLTVYLTDTTKFINRKQEAIGYADLEIGHKVRVKGVWDRELKQIIEVEEIKDFSLPPLPTKTISPTNSI